MLKHELLSKIEHLALKLGECELLWIYMVSDWIAIYVLVHINMLPNILYLKSGLSSTSLSTSLPF